jgi:acyl-CoA synthetase (AMP-forming)/AMP-acid ligase II
MLSYRNKLKLFNPSAEIIEDDGKRHTVKSILLEGNELFSKIPSRSLVILLCKNQFESIFFYLNSIERGIVPILIDDKLDISILNSLIEEYNPNYIFAPKTEKYQYKNFSNAFQLRSYILLENKYKNSINLNPELSLLLSTSGTTGSPKLVRLSFKNLLANATSIAEYLSLNKSHRAISSLPMNYSFGLSIINSHLFAGGSILMTTESITQSRFWELFNNYKITSFSGVPYTFEILKKFRLLQIKLPSLKMLTQAGGKLSNELIEYFAEFSKINKVDFFVMYGQTEGTARLSYLPPEFISKKIGSIGRPIPNGKFTIIDEKGSIINKSGTSGELIYEGPNVMLGYAENMIDLEKGDENFGILKTGDIAKFDDDGFYFIVGRISRFIKLFGNRVNLDDLENLFKNIGIDSACTGRDNNLIVYILDVKYTTFTKEFLTSKLGFHFSVFDIRVIDNFPKSSSGKTLYSKLPY